MDIRRTIIILGLAISSYFLILAYNGDYGQKPETAAIATVSEDVALDVPDTSDAHQAQAEAPNPNNPLAVHAVEAKADNTNLIQVITDTLVVTINLRGGEVVAVKLPAYPASIDQPQVPFS